MMLPDYNTPVENYSIYKKQKLEKTIQKMRNLRNGIDDSSLKQKDKDNLKSILKDMLS